MGHDGRLVCLYMCFLLGIYSVIIFTWSESNPKTSFQFLNYYGYVKL